MGVVDTLLNIRAPRVPDTVRLAEAMRADPTAGLAQLARWLESPAHRDAPADARLAALEAIRGQWRGALEPTLTAVVARAGERGPERWSNFAPGLAIASSLHETQYSRLFRS